MKRKNQKIKIGYNQRLCLAGLQILLGIFLVCSCAKKNVFQEPPGAPAIDSIFPAKGKIGTQIRLFGTGFSYYTSLNSVKVNGVQVRVDSPSSSTVVLATITSVTGTGHVHINVNHNEADGPIFTYDENAVSINSLQPSVGWVDTVVVIHGVGFGIIPDSVKVDFNGHPATIKQVSDTVIIVTAPDALNQTPGTATVTVTVSGRKSNGLNFTYANKPVITGVVNQQWGQQGLYYWIAVSGLSAQPSKNKISVANHDVVIDSIIRQGTAEYAQAPVGEKIAVKRTVVDPFLVNGAADFIVTANGLVSDAFHFQNKPSITKVSSPKRQDYLIAAGDTVTITGNYFGSSQQGSVEIWYNNVDVIHLTPDPAILSWSDTKITIKVPSYNEPGGTALQLFVKQGIMAGEADVAWQVAITNQGIAHVTTIAGDGNSGYRDGPAASAEFSYPIGLTVAPNGNIFVCDAGSIRMIDNTGTVSTIAGGALEGFADGAGSAAKFDHPSAVIMDAAGDLYVVDSHNHCIRKITFNHNPTLTIPPQVSTFAGVGTVNGNADGTGQAARFSTPEDICMDAQGNMYVTDSYNHLIRKITPGAVVTTVAGSGSAGTADGAGTAASFYDDGPNGIAIDNSGDFYITEANGDRLRKMTASGYNVSTIATFHRGYEDGPLATAGAYDPYGICIDKQGNLYFCDIDDNMIRKISGNQVSLVAGTGNPGRDDGLGTEATLHAPLKIAIDAQGNLYVTDLLNFSIRKITFQ